MNKNKGITLIALVVTIIVLLILAAISISILTGPNGIITRTNDARRENVKGTEREQISLAYNAEKSILIEKDSQESVKAEDLENRLRADGANITSVEEEDGRIKVTFDTGNSYYIDEDGNITEGGPARPVNPPALGEIETPRATTDVEFSKPHGVIEIAWLDLNNNVIEKPLGPKLGNMQKVAWDNSNNEITPTSNSNWYNYNTNKWANAKNPEDGSYFVWIPRYAYKIIYFDTEANKNAYIANNTSKTGIIGYSTIYGISNTNGEVTQGSQTNITDTVQTEGYRDYIPHPGFLGTGYENIGGGFGENSKGITGIWVAKYEMAREDSSDNGASWNNVVTGLTTGNLATTKAGSNRNIRAVSKPGLSSWRNINVANSYENAYHYDRNKESHLIKNSEWGAVAYLTHSKYGKNGAEIEPNRNGESYYTGGGQGIAYQENQNQSSTGNTYGIYDLSGNAGEYAAGYANGENDTNFGGNSETGKQFASIHGTSTKYATAYNNNSGIEYADFSVGNVSHAGDAIREVWVQYNQGWFTDYCTFVPFNGSFSRRGGSYYDQMYAGAFYAFHYDGKEMELIGYRVVLAN